MARLDRITGRTIQRVGLSATVGDPEALLAWFAGDRAPGRTVIRGEVGAPTAADVKIDHVGSYDNAATVLARLHDGEKRLVFCDSRARVESLAARLREHGTTTFVSHSSLSLEERRKAEEAFTETADCVICATGTLELGIDVGDLDRVIQIDAPTSVASFLQRMGRTGRRAGSRRNCLFLCTDTESLLFAAGIVRLWLDGYTEPVEPPPTPLHIFGQQLMALVRQERALARADWTGWLAGVSAFPADDAERMPERILSHMLETEVLADDQGVLGIGRRGEALFGRRYFLDLVSSFTTPLLVGVRHGRMELGAVDPVCLTAKEDRGIILLLGGRNWAVTHVDWTARVCFVEPSRELGRSQWLGSSRAARYEHCQAIRRVLGEGLPEAHLSRRAATVLEGLKEEYAWCSDPRPVLLSGPDDRIALWTFAGARANATIGAGLADAGLGVGRTDDFRIAFDRGTTAETVRTVLTSLDPAALEPPVSDRLLEELKFRQCLPDDIARSVVVVRQSDPVAVKTMLDLKPRTMSDSRQ